MKHNFKITLIILAMFVLTQFVGIYVVDYYTPFKVIDGNIINSSAPSLPYGMHTPEIEEETDFFKIFPSILIAFAIAISLLFFLSIFKLESVLRFWFFFVVAIALGISIMAFFPSGIKYASFIVLAAAIPLAYLKIYRRGFFLHNFTEIFIYPGIASVFAPILNIYTIIILLILISIYDMWAVWHSGIMQKMAKYQINTLNIFSGFFVPYISKKIRLEKIKKSELKKKKIKVNVAILGGGDIVFPIITAGVMLREFGFSTILGMQIPVVSLFVILGATMGLSYLFFYAEKKKFYPAMPFITAGIFAGMILSYLFFRFI